MDFSFLGTTKPISDLEKEIEQQDSSKLNPLISNDLQCRNPAMDSNHTVGFISIGPYIRSRREVEIVFLHGFPYLCQLLAVSFFIAKAIFVSPRAVFKVVLVVLKRLKQTTK